jgi:predicted permease
MQSLRLALQTYLMRLGALALLPALAAVLLEQRGVSWLHPHWSAVMLSSVLINLCCFLIALLVIRRFPNDPKTTTFGLFTAVSAHFIFYLLFVLLYYIFQGKPDEVFVLTLMFFYILFLVFELVSLLNILRPLSNEPKKPF